MFRKSRVEQLKQDKMAFYERCQESLNFAEAKAIEFESEALQLKDQIKCLGEPVYISFTHKGPLSKEGNALRDLLFQVEWYAGTGRNAISNDKKRKEQAQSKLRDKEHKENMLRLAQNKGSLLQQYVGRLKTDPVIRKMIANTVVGEFIGSDPPKYIRKSGRSWVLGDVEKQRAIKVEVGQQEYLLGELHEFALKFIHEIAMQMPSEVNRKITNEGAYWFSNLMAHTFHFNLPYPFVASNFELGEQISYTATEHYVSHTYPLLGEFIAGTHHFPFANDATQCFDDEFGRPFFNWAYQFREELILMAQNKIDDLIERLQNLDKVQAEIAAIKNDCESQVAEAKAETAKAQEIQLRLEGILKSNSETTEKILTAMNSRSSLSADDLLSALRDRG